MMALVGGTALAAVMKAKRSSTSDVAQYFGLLLRTGSETAECWNGKACVRVRVGGRRTRWSRSAADRCWRLDVETDRRGREAKAGCSGSLVFANCPAEVSLKRKLPSWPFTWYARTLSRRAAESFPRRRAYALAPSYQGQSVRSVLEQNIPQSSPRHNMSRVIHSGFQHHSILVFGFSPSNYPLLSWNISVECL